MAKIGTFLGVISPVLALGVAALMMFGLGYSYQSGSCRSGYGNRSSGSECSYESGTISALRYALEEGDPTLFYWASFIVAVCLIAAVGALVGRAALIWACAIILYVLAGLGMMSIGLFIFPLAVVLFASAALLILARYERSGA
jgi:hypothetical protein